MAQITSLLNGENINQDHQITALARATITPGVISGLEVKDGKVLPGEAFVLCTRSNGEQIMVHFQNTTELVIDTTGTAHIIVEIAQENLDNGALNAEDGSNIGQIKRVSALPTKNFIALASIANGTITDRREKISHKEGAIKHSDFTLKGTGAFAWTKLGTFEWPEGSRINFRFLGGAGFGANDANAGGVVMEAILTIGNGHHTRNLSGFFTKIFGGSNIFTELRVFRNSNNSWDIAVLHESFAHRTIVQVAHSGTRFIPNFQNYINTPNPSGDTIYNITEYKGNAMDIGGLQEIQEPTNIYDFFPIKEFGGGNKKVTLENLRKWMLPKNSTVTNNVGYMSGYTDAPVALPRGGLVTVSRSDNGDGRASISVEYSTDNKTYKNFIYLQSGWNRAASVSTALVPPWFIRVSRFDSASTSISIQAF